MSTWLYQPTPALAFRVEAADQAHALVLLRAAILRAGAWVPFPQSTTIRREA